MKGPTLHYMSPAEYNTAGTNWAPHLDAALAVRQDVVRHIIGRPLYNSPVDGAVGRHAGQSDKSQHNVDYYGSVRAADFFVPGAPAAEVVTAMMQAGFTGIGVYPGGLWKGEQETRYHGDVRSDRSPSDPATWGFIDGRTVSIEEAVAAAVR